jgi:hypothetical protein
VIERRCAARDIAIDQLRLREGFEQQAEDLLLRVGVCEGEVQAACCPGGLPDGQIGRSHVRQSDQSGEHVAGQLRYAKGVTGGGKSSGKIAFQIGQAGLLKVQQATEPDIGVPSQQ